jgi:hypothetical protein
MKSKKKSSEAKLKGKLVTREVEIGLDEKTRAKLAEELGEKLKAKTKLDLEFADVKAKWKERITPVSDRVAAIENFLENGKEKKTVECLQVKNFESGRMEWLFEGKIVDHRPLTDVDHQEEIALKTKRGRTKENSVKAVQPTEDEEISNVRKLETSKKTKHTATDGPTGNGLDGVYSS